MAVEAAKIKQLREATGAGVMDIKAALISAKGDVTKATQILRTAGHAKAQARSSKATTAGLVDGYLHQGRVGVLVEVSCETDFVARTPEFKEFVHDLAMQIASMNPRYISLEDVPSSEIKTIPETQRAEFYARVCLLRQPDIKEPTLTIETKLKDLISRLGENIVIKRFVRYELGEV